MSESVKDDCNLTERIQGEHIFERERVTETVTVDRKRFIRQR